MGEIVLRACRYNFREFSEIFRGCCHFPRPELVADGFSFFPTSKAGNFVNIGSARAALGGGTPISYLYRHQPRICLRHAPPRQAQILSRTMNAPKTWRV